MPRPRPEEGIAQCLSGIDWYLDSPQVDWLCCRFQGTLDGHPQQPSEHVIDPADCGVGVGMGTHEGNAVANKPVNDASLGGIRCHRRGAPHQKRMVNDKHIGVGPDGGINDGVSGFQGANDPLDGVVGISAYQTGGVPRFCQGWRIPLIQSGAYLADSDLVAAELRDRGARGMVCHSFTVAEAMAVRRPVTMMVCMTVARRLPIVSDIARQLDVSSVPSQSVRGRVSG